MLSANLDLSRQVERAEAEAGREFAEARARLEPGSKAAWMEQSGTIAVFDGPDSPVTQTFCLGLFESLTSSALDTIERFFIDRGAPVIHEVSPFAGIATIDLLCARGYRPIELSSVLYQPVSAPESHPSSSSRVHVAPDEDAEMWADLSARGWASDYPEMEASIRKFGTVAFARRNTVNFVAGVDGEAGATGSLCFYGEVALFGGASTIPGQRRRGLQSALLASRMAYAFEQRYTLAMMVTALGTQSQRNAERAGFKIAYTRTKWQLRTCD